MATEHNLAIIIAKYNSGTNGSCIIHAFERSTGKKIGSIPLYLSSKAETVYVCIRFDINEFPNVKTNDDIELKTQYIGGEQLYPFTGELEKIVSSR